MSFLRASRFLVTKSFWDLIASIAVRGATFCLGLRGSGF